MKFKIVGVLFCLLLVLAVVVPVYAKATVTEFTDPFWSEFPDTNPCTGEPVTITIIGESKTRIVEDGSGKVHGTFKVRAYMMETNDLTGEVFEGFVNWNRSFGPDQYTFVITGKVEHPGPGQNVIVHLVSHLSPNGMSFDSGKATECR
jgi:hypothetical protein